MFTMPDFGVHGADPGVHEADLTVHDDPISVFTMRRFERSRWPDFRTTTRRDVRGCVPIGLMLADSASGDVGELRDGV
ncbi:MAG: hypothetical protein ACRDKD_10495, partial [Solirubrobacteraceae bacterium]